MARMKELRKQNAAMEEELKLHAENDPAVIEALGTKLSRSSASLSLLTVLSEEDIKTSVVAANRWTGSFPPLSLTF